MPRHFSIAILLQEEWPLDIDAIGAALRRRFPQIGAIDAVPGQVPGHQSGIVRIDGGHVVISSSPEPFPEDMIEPPLKVMRSWRPERTIKEHKAHLLISCGGDLPGLEGAKAYAAAAHFVAAAATTITPASAIVWQRGYCVTRPEDFRESATTLLSGRMPLGAWVSFATVVPRGYAPEAATGMVSYGLRPFLGRELEGAPRPGDPRSAYDCIADVARRALGQGLELNDGLCIEDAALDQSVTVREKTFWLRRDLSAYVLVAGDAVVDPETLRPLRQPAA